MQQIIGELQLDRTTKPSYRLLAPIGVYQLEVSDAILPQVQTLAGQRVVISGEYVGPLPYGAIFRVDAIASRPE